MSAYVSICYTFGFGGHSHTINTRIPWPFSLPLFKTAVLKAFSTFPKSEKIIEIHTTVGISKYKVSIYTDVNCVIKSNL